MSNAQFTFEEVQAQNINNNDQENTMNDTQNNMAEAMVTLHNHNPLDKWYSRIWLRYLCWSTREENIQKNNCLGILLVLFYWLVLPSHWAVWVLVLIPSIIAVAYGVWFTTAHRKMVVATGEILKQGVAFYEEERRQRLATA